MSDAEGSSEQSGIESDTDSEKAHQIQQMPRCTCIAPGESRRAQTRFIQAVCPAKNLQALQRTCCWSVCGGTAVAEESEIFQKDTPLRRNCRSFVSERRSNQESELACLHGVRNRYEDAPQLDMHLPTQEQNPGTSLCVLS